MADDTFTVWLAKASGIYAGDKPVQVAGNRTYAEPAQAADVAEHELQRFGFEGESYAEIRFNGDIEPHTMIFFLKSQDGIPTYGVWNTGSALWPIFYPESPYGTMLEGWPEGFEPPEIESDTSGDSEDDGFGETDEDSNLMNLSNDGSEDDEDADEDDDDGDDEEDENDDESDEEDDDEIEEEDSTDDSSEDEDEEADESEDPDDDEDEDEISDEGEEDADELDEEGDEDGDGENEDEEDESDDEEETEMPRLNIFAKMRGPKGWRKRADAEELLDRNVFAMKVGVLDDDEELTPAQREKNVRAHVEFIESDADRKSGTLRIKLPRGMTLDDFTQTKSGWITAAVPYYDPEED